MSCFSVAVAAICSADHHVCLPGRKGIGTRKRALSPTAAERMAKMAKMAETAKQSSFRDRAMQDYAERRAEGRLCMSNFLDCTGCPDLRHLSVSYLVSAQRTCANLDEKADIKVYLSLVSILPLLNIYGVSSSIFSA